MFYRSSFFDSHSKAMMVMRKRSLSSSSSSIGGSLIIGSLTDTRLPKRRPGTKHRRKRASLRPPGPHAWVQYVPRGPIPSSRPNEGSVKGRKHRKHIAQRPRRKNVKFSGQRLERRKQCRRQRGRWLQWQGKKLGPNDQ